jgi:hypothetical protein
MPFIGVQPATVPLTSSDITDGIISTAKIADDAVGNTKLDLSANYAFTGTVTGADMALLHTTTVTSNVGQVQIDGHFTSAFKVYKIIGSNIHSVSNAVALNLKFMSGGSLATGSVHRSIQIKAVSNSSTLNGVNEASDTEFANSLGQKLGDQDGEHTNFELTLFDPLATDNFKSFMCQAMTKDSDGNARLLHTGGTFNSGQSALSGIEAVCSSGDIASGVFKLYGLR